MQTIERHKPRPVLDAERRAEAAERRASAAEAAAAVAKAEASHRAAENADLRQDRDRWRAQAERLAGALDKPEATIEAAAQAVLMPSPHGSDDVLYGVPAIAAAFRLKDRQVYHLKAKHGLPTFKVGKSVCARRADVAAWLAAHHDPKILARQGGL